jgi:hypothetical protein
MSAIPDQQVVFLYPHPRWLIALLICGGVVILLHASGVILQPSNDFAPSPFMNGLASVLGGLLGLSAIACGLWAEWKRIHRCNTTVLTQTSILWPSFFSLGGHHTVDYQAIKKITVKYFGRSFQIRVIRPFGRWPIWHIEASLLGAPEQAEKLAGLLLEQAARMGIPVIRLAAARRD